MTESLFDYLKEACAVGGYNMTIRGVPSAVHKYISVGASPMIGIYTASQVVHLWIQSFMCEDCYFIV